MIAYSVPLVGLAAVQVVVLVAMMTTHARSGGPSDLTVIPATNAVNPASAPVGEPTPDYIFASEVRPLLDQFCFKCHGPERQKGDINLSLHDKTRDIRRHRKTFHRAWEMLNTREMPPEDKPQPTEQQREQMVAFLETELNRLDCDGPRDPGRVVLRRLSRYEYRNTIRDLLGVEYQPGPEFPMDDIGYGFDNIGDVMSLPPLLMEKYLTAAESILDKAIADDRPPEPWSQRVLAVNMKDTTGGNDPADDTRRFSSNGEAATTLKFPVNGSYLIEVLASGEVAGGAAPKMAVRIDGRVVQEFDVDAPQNKPGRYSLKANLTAGDHVIALAFTNDYYNPKAERREDRDRNLIIAHMQVRGPVDLPSVEPAEVERRIFIAMPSSGVSPRDAAAAVVKRFATRAFRRPAADAEVDRLLTLYDLAVKQGLKFEPAVGVALGAVLVSPHFLFRVETDPPTSGDPIVPVDAWDLATRLSYFLWSTMPDESLTAAAESGELLTEDGLEKQVRRMLADPRSRALADNFAEQWLQIRRLDDASPDTKRFPMFNDELRRAMRDEVAMFFDAVVREDRPITELLDAKFTYVNGPLADLYGIEGVAGPQMRRVDLTDPSRGGVLTMAAPLTVTSHAERTSPVKRGKWVLEVILGTPPPPPSPEAGELDDTVPVDQKLSLRDRLEQHRADPSCAICHRRIDPLGFGFETFDPIGRSRTVADGHPVDATGTLIDGRSFNGPVELKRVLLADRDDFARALAEKMLIYAIGRGLEHYDACAIKQIAQGVRRENYRFSALVLEITRSLPFRYRRSAEHQNSELTEIDG